VMLHVKGESSDKIHKISELKIIEKKPWESLIPNI